LREREREREREGGRERGEREESEKPLTQNIRLNYYLLSKNNNFV